MGAPTPGTKGPPRAIFPVGSAGGTVWRGCPTDHGKVTPSPSLSSLWGCRTDATVEGWPPLFSVCGTAARLMASVPSGQPQALPQVPRPKFLPTIPLPDLNTLVEVNLHLTGSPHDRGRDGSPSQPWDQGWRKRWFTCPVTVSWGSRNCGDSRAGVPVTHNSHAALCRGGIVMA